MKINEMRSIKKWKKSMIHVWKLFDTYFSPHERRFTIPNLLTFLRLLLTPCIVAFLAYEYWRVALGLFCVSAITDMLDGFIARRYNQHTMLGACLDPLADKLLVGSVFVTIALKKNPYVTLSWWFVGIVLLKDFVLVAGSLFMFSINNSVSVRPSLWGKGAMVMQVIALVWFLGALGCGYSSSFIHTVIINLVIFFGVASLIHYVYNGWVAFNCVFKNRE